jgi:deoxyadenosine/deoxycytidine kinase
MTYSSGKPLIVSLEGNIGAGKSTLLRKFQEWYDQQDHGTEPRWVFLYEPVETWNTFCDSDGNTMLQKFYSDPVKYAFSFQVMAYVTRLKELETLLEAHPHCAGVLCERSLLADHEIFAKMLHDDGTLEDVLYQIYNQFVDKTVDRASIDGVVYVHAPVDVCIERISQRAREGESDISKVYLQRCEDYHTAWLLSTEKPCTFPILRIDTTPGEQGFPSWIEKVNEFLHNMGTGYTTHSGSKGSSSMASSSLLYEEERR